MIKKISKGVILFVISTSLVILTIFIYQNQITIKKLSNNKTAPPEIFPSPPPPSPTPSAKSPIASTPLATQNAIRTTVNSKDYQALSPYFTETVDVIIESSDCCGQKSRQEATDTLNLLNEGVPFDFNQNQEITKKLKAQNQTLTSSFIGISTKNEQTVAFELDNTNHIAKITMATTWKLYGL